MKKYILCSLVIGTTALSMEIDHYQKAQQRALQCEEHRLQLSRKFENHLKSKEEDEAMAMIENGLTHIDIGTFNDAVQYDACKVVAHLWAKGSGRIKLNFKERKPDRTYLAGPTHPLALAIYKDHPDMVAYLIEMGAEVNNPFYWPPYWTTPLAFAKRLNHSRCAAILEEHSAQEIEEEYLGSPNYHEYDY